MEEVVAISLLHIPIQWAGQKRQERAQPAAHTAGHQLALQLHFNRSLCRSNPSCCTSAGLLWHSHQLKLLNKRESCQAT